MERLASAGKTAQDSAMVLSQMKALILQVYGLINPGGASQQAWASRSRPHYQHVAVGLPADP
ncbi:hypothetical protein [Streptomyces ehimensis]|uniref:Uncharacterized protein n=1 Tax=Streptomyces ehimensis TaxID=68195 RepID=A0ABV9BXJ4_9ACTN